MSVCEMGSSGSVYVSAEEIYDSVSSWNNKATIISSRLIIYLLELLIEYSLVIQICIKPDENSKHLRLLFITFSANGTHAFALDKYGRDLTPRQIPGYNSQLDINFNIVTMCLTRAFPMGFHSGQKTGP